MMMADLKALRAGQTTLAAVIALAPHRTLTQDSVFPIDQLVEIAIRALSPAVNDTFTALTCIDWLSDGLCKVTAQQLSEGMWAYRDAQGAVRVILPGPNYVRMLSGRRTRSVRPAETCPLWRFGKWTA
jgi:uncharacterized membrane protein